jgi:type IX secretion system PorP/SprF family membrane protein
MKKIIIFIFFLTVLNGFGQELNLPVFTQYLADNDFVVSPTYAGIGDELKIRANGLTQWVGIKGAPDNQSIYADFRISNRSGVGISAYNDKNGNTRQKGIKFSFAHHLTLDYKTKQFLSFGISYNINSFRIDIENFNTTFETPIIDPSIDGDRAISNNNFDAGILYRYKGFFLSLNANNLIEKDTDPFTGLEPSRLLNFQVYSGLVIGSKTDKSIEFEPSVFYQMFNSDRRSSTDINLNLENFKEMVIIFGSVHPIDSLTTSFLNH